MKFTISPYLTMEELYNSIILMIDQTTRRQEQQENFRSNKLEISGYTNNPEVALRIYQLAILQDLRPEIHPKMFKEWQTKSENKGNPDQAKFQKALNYISRYQKHLAEGNIDKLKKLIGLHQELNKEGISLKEYLAQKKHTSQNRTNKPK